MSFQKAVDLLRLAEIAAARHGGVGLQEIAETFGCDHRTAQRMTRALEDCFPATRTITDDQRRKFWTLRGAEARLMAAQGIRDSELVALNMSIQRAERDDAPNEVRALRSLRDRLLAAMPSSHARRAETDAEAMLEAIGFASRPGPRVRSDVGLLDTIAAALKGPHLLTITYAGADGGEGAERLLEPYGLLLGTRRYLVARQRGNDERFRHFRLDRIRSARLHADSFARDPAFKLEDHAARAFGSYHADHEYGEVVWRFTPHAAATARAFLFHPRQEMTDEPDGALTVRFHAGGWLEMAWHLYYWGDSVEVLAPEPLRLMIDGYRRGDFPALP